MAERVRIAALGLTHDHVWDNLPDVQAHDRAELVAAADRNEKLRKRAADEYGCKTYEDHEQLVREEKPDAVYVFADNAGGAELATWALEQGLPVMIEKPMAADLASAEKMLAAAKSSGATLMINWPFAWWPALQRAVEIALANQLGRLWQVTYRAAHAGPKEMGCSEFFVDWLYDPRRNGAGAYMDYCCYGADLARLLLGMPSGVDAVTGHLRDDVLDVDDNALLTMSYPAALALTYASWSQIGHLTSYVTAIYGTQGTLLVEPPPGKLYLATSDEPKGREIDIPEPADQLKNATANFVHAFDGGKLHPLCEPELGRDVQAILDAGLNAARNRKGEVPSTAS